MNLKRILVAGVQYDDSFAQNVAVTLRNMGHDVREMPGINHALYYSRPAQVIRMTAQFLRDGRPNSFDHAVLAQAQNFKPDCLIATTQAIHPEILLKLKKYCGVRILWWGDHCATNQKMGLLDSEWDCVYVKSPALLKKLRILGRRSELLHEAMNPIWHRPVGRERNGNLAVVGNYYAFRQALVQRLHSDHVALALYGSRPPSWSLPAVRSGWNGKYVVGEEKSRIFGEALACLNTFHLPEFDSLNCRAFEIAGSGGVQIIEETPLIEECFEPGKEILVFKTYEGLLEHLERLKMNPAEGIEIGQLANRRALAQHTYEHRLRRVIMENL